MSQSGPRRPAAPVNIPSSFGLTCKEAANNIRYAMKMTQHKIPRWEFSWFTDMDTVLLYVDHIGGAGGMLFVDDDKHRWYPDTIKTAGYLIAVQGVFYLIYLWIDVSLVIAHISALGVPILLVLFIYEDVGRRMWGSRFTRDQIVKAYKKRGRKRRAGRATIGDLTAVVDVTGGELSVCEQGQLTGVEG